MSSASREQLEAWLKTIEVPSGSSVVDIGGAQKPVKGRTKTWDPARYFIWDLSQPHELAENAKSELAIKSDVQDGFDSSELNFDIAFCLEVSEYWLKPFDAIKNIAFVLKRGGLLYISFHFIYPHHEPFGRDFLRYTFHGAEKLLCEANFGILEALPRVARNKDDLLDLYSLEGMKGAHDFPDHGATGWLFKAQKL